MDGNGRSHETERSAAAIGPDLGTGIGHPDLAASVAETHSAWVVFLGDRAYKIKKPVTLDFLDFSTRAARERVAHREVELNRRLAPDVYLGVADVHGPDGALCDHMVVMRRMPADRRLSARLQNGTSIDDDIRRIARTIAAFHAEAATSSEIARAGSPEAIRNKLERDLGEIAPYSTRLDRHVLADVARLVRRYLDGRAALFEARVVGGHIRDGHGDLLADDIFCLDDGPRIIDCIEFDDRLRYGDVLADVAFLAMDLERLGAPEHAARFLAWYGEFSNEHHPQSLAHYYVAARALIRAKVACIRDAQGHAGALNEASALLALTRAHLRRAQVVLVLVGGAPGTGKSTLAAALGDRLGWGVLRSDEVRKDVTGVGRATSHVAPLDQGIYDSGATRATYAALLQRAERAMRFGEPVILDASWSRGEWRALALRLAREVSADLVELRCDVPTEIARRRIERRGDTGDDVSDATAEIADAIRASFERWPSATVVPTTGTLDESLRAALDVVEQRPPAPDPG